MSNVNETEFDYEQLLDRTMDEIGDGPKKLPTGSWLLRGVSNVYKTSEETGQAPKVMFIVIPEAPGDDVDPDELADVGQDWHERQFISFNIETGSDAANVRKVLSAFGVDLGQTTIKAALVSNKALIRGKGMWATAVRKPYVRKSDNTAQVAVNFSDFQAIEA